MQLPAYAVQVQGPGKCTGCEIESQAFLKREGSFQVSLGREDSNTETVVPFHKSSSAKSRSMDIGRSWSQIGWINSLIIGFGMQGWLGRPEGLFLLG